MVLHPSQDTSARLAASVAHIKGGDFEAAETLLSTILAAEPHPVALYLLGVTRFERGHWPEAEELFRQALALSPGQPQICLHLAQCLRALRRPDEALAFCRTVLRAQPDDLGARLELAKAQEESGAMAEAEATYRRILTGNNDPEATLNFSLFLSKIGRAPEAETMLRAALADKDAAHG